MLRTFKATVDENGNVRLLEPVRLPAECQVLVTVLDEGMGVAVSGITLLSEQALAEDWDRPEEVEAWAYLLEEEEQGQ
jgi:hypothetical protein